MESAYARDIYMLASQGTFSTILCLLEQYRHCTNTAPSRFIYLWVIVLVQNNVPNVGGCVWQVRRVKAHGPKIRATPTYSYLILVHS